MNWRQLLRLPARYTPDEDCLRHITTDEARAAAAALDNGDQAPADALVARVEKDHRRCAAFAVLQFVGTDESEVAR